MVEGTEPHRFDGVFGAGKGRQDDHRRRIAAGTQPAENFDAIHPSGHAQIEQHRIDIIRHCGEALASGGRHTRRVTEISERLGKAFAHCAVVVYDQDGCHGTSISNIAPAPEWASRASPPWRRAISRTMASPRPVPSARPVTKGSNSRDFSSSL